jgi:hypothetical protein
MINDKLWITLSVIVLVAILGGSYMVRESLKGNPWVDKGLFDRGMELPPLWLYYDNSQVNSRHWLDFGARSSRALNKPFLNLCYETIVRANGKHYRVEVIGGIDGLAQRFGEDWLPAKLRGVQGRIANVGPAEKNWIRAAILAKYGGLWLDAGTICLREFGELPKDKIVFFGTDLDETFSGEGGTAVPGMRAVWVSSPNNPLMVAWEQACRRRLDTAGGGTQIRGDEKWDFVRFFASAKESVAVVPGAELARKGKSGRRIQLEDLLSNGTIPFDVPAEAIYIALPMRDIELRSQYGWFMRLSENQIMESDLVVAQLLKYSLSN